MSRTGIATCLAMGAVVAASFAFAEPPLAEVRYFGTSVEFSPNARYQGFLLKIATPDGSVVDKIIKDGVPSFDLTELEGGIVDGRYKYELHPIVSLPRERDVAPQKAGSEPRIKTSSLSGSFLVANGNIIPPGSAKSEAAAGGPDAPDEQVINDTLIVTGRACIGPDCASGEIFIDDEIIRLKATGTAISFVDTSASGYPSNDWKIATNHSMSDNFGVYDLETGDVPFRIDAGADNNVLFVDSNERIGINTSTPANELHIYASSAPAISMEQASPTPYRWDMFAYNEYWCVRDLTGDAWPLFLENYETGSRYGLALKSDGKFGQGTFTPTYQFEVYRDGVNSNVVVTRAGGAQNYINATASFGNFGTVTDHPLRLVVNAAWQMRINNDSSISMANGASLTAGGVWTDASSRTLKKEIKSLSIEEATSALADLEPVKFAFKANDERHVGFIAEDVPELVAGADHNGLSPMDVVAVLTRVVQQQQIVDLEQKKMLQEQQKHTESLQATINQLLARISALESQ